MGAWSRMGAFRNSTLPRPEMVRRLAGFPVGVRGLNEVLVTNNMKRNIYLTKMEFKKFTVSSKTFKEAVKVALAENPGYSVQCVHCGELLDTFEDISFRWDTTYCENC